MANFKVHLSVASVTSGLGAVALLTASLARPADVFLYLAGGIIGGILPDMDADNSKPLQLAFTVFAMLFSFVIMFSQSAQYAVLELALIWLLSFLFVRWGIFTLFTHLTVHRGMFHAIPSALLACFVCTVLCYRLLGLGATLSWMTGLFVLQGYLVHLALDELYSLNLFGLAPRRSLGSALKLYGTPGATILVYLLLAAFLYITPEFKKMNAFFNAESFTTMEERFYPDGGLFSEFRSTNTVPQSLHSLNTLLSLQNVALFKKICNRSPERNPNQ